MRGAEAFSCGDCPSFGNLNHGRWPSMLSSVPEGRMARNAQPGWLPNMDNGPLPYYLIAEFWGCGKLRCGVVQFKRRKFTRSGSVMNIEAGKQVLLVEDDDDAVRSIGQLLTRNESDEPFWVTRVRRLDDALAAARARTFDVAILDLALPDSKGYKTFETF